MKSRFQYGGQSPNRMQLVYINLKEITENPVGVGKVPFIDTYLGTRLLLRRSWLLYIPDFQPGSVL